MKERILYFSKIHSAEPSKIRHNLRKKVFKNEKKKIRKKLSIFWSICWICLWPSLPVCKQLTLKKDKGWAILILDFPLYAILFLTHHKSNLREENLSIVYLHKFGFNFFLFFFEKTLFFKLFCGSKWTTSQDLNLESHPPQNGNFTSPYVPNDFKKNLIFSKLTEDWGSHNIFNILNFFFS